MSLTNSKKVLNLEKQNIEYVRSPAFKKPPSTVSIDHNNQQIDSQN